MSLHIESVTVEHLRQPFGVGSPQPRLSWTINGTDGSEQQGYEISITGARRPDFRTGTIRRRDSTLQPWPDTPLISREQVTVLVRVCDEQGQFSDWSVPTVIEASLLERADWSEPFVSPSLQSEPGVFRPAYLLRAEFDVPPGVIGARVYGSAHGVYEFEINAERVGSTLLDPGWTSFQHRIRHQTYDISTQLRPGRNAIGAWLADGWYRGRLGFNGGLWDIYGRDVSLLAQLELTLADGSTERVPLKDSWKCSAGPITGVGIYEGETYDARLYPAGWSTPGFDDSRWQLPVPLPLESFPAALECATGPAVAVTETLKPHTVEVRPDGNVRFDFGQNISGRIRARWSGHAGQMVTLHHAEVLEHDELAIRPLRTAAAIDRYTFRGNDIEEWAPRFTFHGFRYAELEGWHGDLSDLTIVAEVLHSDMRRTGWFTSSHEMLNKLHENTVWGMRGNFVDLPTDCPQRDERLGWTGDIQVFAPAASFLYASTGTLIGWLRDVAAEQQAMGSVPNFVPWIDCGFPADPAAAWGDAAVIVPWVLYERTGDSQILRDQLSSMKAWVGQVERLSGGTGLWNTGFQLGDWLDPTAPPENPGESRTDKYLVACAYFVRSSQLLAQTCEVLGEHSDFERYDAIHRKAKAAFQAEYVSSTGRVVSDTPTALSLALVFDLLDNKAHRVHAGARLVQLVVDSDHRIDTGFVGTPIICDALVQAGAIDTAYHLLLQDQFPSWLYPVTLGATTIWERWDSLLPNGDVNPGEMTSFNHYALGAVVDFMHRVVAGLAPAAPGYAEMRVAPQPGGGLVYASAKHLTPFGPAEVAWQRVGTELHLDVTVPHGVLAHVWLPGQNDPRPVRAGSHHFETPFRAVEDDPPRPIKWQPHSREAVAERAGQH